MKRGIFAIAAFASMLGIILTACSSPIIAGPKKQVILTLWHNYGGQLKDTMDEMIDKFNETVGAKEGIIISVTSISGSETLHDKPAMAANGEPGAPPLPDITTAYPKTALILIEYLKSRNKELYRKAMKGNFSISLLDEFLENIKTLSPSERAVFDLYAKGYTSKEAAKILFLSINTIKTHTKRIYMKLSVASRKELLLYISMLKEIGKDIQ